MLIGPAQVFAAIVANHPPVAELVPASPATLAKLNAIHEWTMQFEQTPIGTEHLIHGGMYARTIRLEPETIMNGSLIKAPTILIVHGRCLVVTGDAAVEIDGYNVFPGCAGRKQTFVTRGVVEMTMLYATSAKTVAEAEDEVFAEADLLMSRRDGDRDTITVTGE